VSARRGESERGRTSNSNIKPSIGGTSCPVALVIVFWEDVGGHGYIRKEFPTAQEPNLICIPGDRAFGPGQQLQVQLFSVQIDAATENQAIVLALDGTRASKSALAHI